MREYINGGYFKSDGLWRHPERRIDSNEIIYVTKGEVDINEEGTEYHLKAGDVLFLEKNMLHKGTKESCKAEFYWFHFNGDCDFKFVPNTGNSVKILLKQLLHYENTPTYPREIMDLMLKIIMIEIKTCAEANLNVANPITAEVKEWIRTHSEQPVTISEISEKFGYNSDYLCRMFKASYGISLKSYTNQQRCSYIKSLLVSTEYNINEIAQITGFDSYQTFLKYFTYHENISPKKFRSLYFNTHINQK